MIFGSARWFTLARMGLAALVVVGLSPVWAAVKTEEPKPDKAFFDADSIDTDFKTHVMHLKGNVVITYGKMTVRADRAFATEGNFKDSRWQLDGNVRINGEAHGNLRSDQAVVEFEDSQLKRATATGNPAEFDQKREDNVTTHGQADTIIYEVGAGTVRLSNDAYVNDGKDDIRAPTIVYSLREEHVEATTQSGGRVHVTITPPNDNKTDGGGTNKVKPAPTDPNKSPTTPAQPSDGTPAPPKP